MINLSYCNSIDQILTSQKIDCDALLMKTDTMQCAIVYQSKAFKIFTDNLITESCKYFCKEYLIHKLPNIIHAKNSSQIQQLSKTLHTINTSYTLAIMLKYLSEYFYAKTQAQNLNSPAYQKFYNAKSNSYIWLNSELLNSDFDDILQVKIDCKELEGVYMNRKSHRQLAIYLDAFTNSWKFTNRSILQDSTQNHKSILT